MGRTLTTRLAIRVAAVFAVVWACPAIALASAVDPQSLASTLQRDPVQSIGVPSRSFTSLSEKQLVSLRAEIAKLDPGRIWILLLSPRSQSSIDSLGGPLFGALPAGTLIAAAEDPKQQDLTHFWVGASWEPGAQAENQFNDTINGFHKGQGTLFQDLQLAVRRFARGDAAAGHPALSSGSGNSGQSGAASGAGVSEPSGASSGGGSSHVLLIIVLVVVGLLLLTGLITGARRLPGAMRSSHRRREQSADARQQANADLVKLGEQISALDIDSSMANASQEGKDHYAKAIQYYEDAEGRLKQADDPYQFEQAVAEIKHGLWQVKKADEAFNPAPAPKVAKPTGEVVDELTELSALHDRGALTDAEFAEQKSKLLGT